MSSPTSQVHFFVQASQVHHKNSEEDKTIVWSNALQKLATPKPKKNHRPRIVAHRQILSAYMNTSTHLQACDIIKKIREDCVPKA